MIKEFLEIGEIVGTHGVRGEMRVNPWSDSPDFLCDFKTFYTGENAENEVVVTSSRTHGNVVLITVQGIDSVEKAVAMRSTVLKIRRSDAKLPEGSFFIAELMGCTVLDKDDESKIYGEISDVSYTGANDVWHIKKDDKVYLIPVIPQVVDDSDIDVSAGIVKIRPLRGIFDDEN